MSTAGRVSLAAAMTTAAAFGALVWTRELGVLAAFGLVLVWLCCVTLLPALLGLALKLVRPSALRVLPGVAAASRFAHGPLWIGLVGIWLIVVHAPRAPLDRELKVVLAVTITAALFVLIVTLGKVRLALLALAPAVVILAVTLGLVPLLGFDIRDVDVGALPILLGIGVLGGAHLVARVDAGEPLVEAWGRTGWDMTGAILGSALGFGVLAIASGSAVASLARLVLIGLGVSFFVCVWIFPLALTVFGVIGPRRPSSSLAEKIVTVGYAGRSAVAPGTVGAIQAIPIALVLSGTSIVVRSAVCVALTAISVVFSEMYVKEIAKNEGASKDPQNIVIDETVGCLIALCCVPFEPLWVAAGFVLFRFFDIAKPGPVRWADRNLKGGLGVVMDDVVAGIFAGAILLGARALL